MDPHKPQEKCPAKYDRCSKCRKIGHWAKECLSKPSVHGLEEGETDNESEYEYVSEENELESVRLLNIRGIDLSINEVKMDDDWWETIRVGKGKL